jgi:vancomycin resistance protein VanJ
MEVGRDVIVPCRGGGHRVRLGKGLRFWRAARCPRCRSPVDPTRLRRATRWWANLLRPASAAWTRRAAWLGAVAYLAFALGSAVLLWSLSDRWWPATVLLFGPRWTLLLPLALLIPTALLWDRPLLAPLVLAGLLILGPVMGLRTGWRTLLPGGEGDGAIRLVSFNAQGGGSLSLSPPELLAGWMADIVGIQECGPSLAEGLRRVPGWEIHARTGLCLASRFPIEEVRQMDREALEFAGGSGLVTTYRLDVRGETVHVTNLHLETPRAGFELLRSGRLAEGIPKTREKSFLRDVELRRARLWVDRFQGPHIVLGDFNTAPESRSYRRSWGDWQNAFSITGRGLGGTRLNGWIRVRIDHVVTDGHWAVMGSWLGEDLGSDHLPLLAEVRIR